MTEPTAADTNALDQLLGQGASRPWWRRPASWIAALLVLALAGGALWWRASRTEARAPQYVTTPLARGNLTITVTANGTLQPTRSVAIGSELSGTVTRVLVDVNDVVRKGQLMVELDTAKLRDAVAGARADLAAAQARARQAAATVTEARAALARLDELARLSAGKLPSQAEHESARAALARAVADEASAQAGVAQVQAALSTSETNLGKAAIRSPIDGVVLSRNVEPGYAVAASLQAVTLFTLAEDLSRLRLSVNVDEADVGQVRAGQQASFTVAAQPGRQYPATLTRVAFGSTITDNVVTYTTLLDVANEDLSLRPGMTATATIAATERRDVWLVPNSALRYAPSGVATARNGNGGGGAGSTSAAAGNGGPPAAGTGATGGTGAGGSTGGTSILSRLMPRPPGAGTPRSATTNHRPGGEATIWLLRDGAPTALRVRKGLSDGRSTEVTGEGLQAGLAVITDQTSGTR